MDRKPRNFDELYVCLADLVAEQVMVKTEQLEREIVQLKRDKRDLLKLLLETADRANTYKDMLREKGDIDDLR